MEDNIIKQDPLFDLSNLEFFNLAIRSDNLEWEKYIEEMLLLRFINFRYSHINKNYDMLLYFLNLVEGNFLVFKSKVAQEAIFKMKNKLMQYDDNITKEYIQIVNLVRLVYVYVIQLLYDNNVRLNGNMIQKFLVLDSELDKDEKKVVSSKLLKYDYVNSIIDTTKKLDYRSILNKIANI